MIARYEDGAEEAIFSGYTCEYDFSEAGTKTVTVAFGGKTAFFEVSVKKAFVSGDVNGDGVINGRDSGLLLQYLAEWDVEIVEEAADTNGDGVVNGRDSGLLLQYLADWDVVLG